MSSQATGSRLGGALTSQRRYTSRKQEKYDCAQDDIVGGNQPMATEMVRASAQWQINETIRNPQSL